MKRQFLAFVDEATQFGKVFIPSDRLFEMFCEKNGLSGNHAFGFRLRLEKAGVL